jgi:hypothetical protein
VEARHKWRGLRQLLELGQLLTQRQLAEQLLLLVAGLVEMAMLMGVQAVLVAVGEDRAGLQKPEALQLLDKVMPEEIIFLKVGSVLLVEAGEPDLLE